MNADHVIHDTNTRSLNCKNCGQSMPDGLPMNLDVFLAMTKAFLKIHKKCKEPKR